MNQFISIKLFQYVEQINGRNDIVHIVFDGYHIDSENVLKQVKV